MSGKIAIDYVLPGVLILPEILKIIQSLIEHYNNYEADSAPVKLCSDEIDGSVNRYQSYASKEDLFEAIVANCPSGLRIISVK
jgi:hypothetical protein